MPTDPLTSDAAADEAEERLPARPVQQLESKSKTPARKKLLEQLQAIGFDENASNAVARAIVDPELALMQLRAPAELGVHGGTIRYISARVLNGSVLPIPTNPRVSERVRYPAGGAASGGIEPLQIADLESGSAGLQIRASSPAGLRQDMREGYDYIVGNNDLLPSVEMQGVLLPITLIPVTFEFADGSVRKHVACAIDGSSRLTAAMRTWGLESSEVLFDLTDDDKLKTRAQKVADLLKKDQNALSQKDFSMLRNQAIPANIIVGWDSAEDGVSFRHLLDAYLGLLHVEPPKPWGESAGQDKRADSVLDELERAGRIDADRKRYLAGLMEPSEASELGLNPSLDGRAAEVFYELDRRSNVNAVNRALRRIGMHNPARIDRLEVATELAVRPYRSSVTSLVRRNPRQALPSAVGRMRPDGLWSPSLLDPAELHSIATDTDNDTATETDIADRKAASAELALRGSFWLTRHSVLQKSSRVDTRFAEELVEDMRTGVHGLHVFRQAIEDGRLGLAPRQVGPGGELVSNATGEQLLVTDRWLRETFESSAEPDDDTDENDEPWTPQDELRSKIYAVRDEATLLAEKVADLGSVVDVEGRSLVEVDGVPSDIEKEVAGALDAARTRVQILGNIWASRNDSEMKN